MKRRTLASTFVALFLVALFAAVPSHASTGAPSPAACAAVGNDLDFAWLTGGGCLSGFCRSVADCPCSGASSITCNGTCHYTFPGGGGGGNPHGCLHGFCNSSADCRCSDGTFAACIGNTCSF
jgi:hypothetical protein